MSVRPINPPVLKDAEMSADFLSAMRSVDDSDHTLDLARYVGFLKHHALAVTFFVVLGILIGVVKIMLEVPLYRAELSLLLEQDQSNLAGVQGAVIFALPNHRFYQTQFEIIKSRALLQDAAEKFKENHQSFFIKKDASGRVTKLFNRLIPWRSGLSEGDSKSLLNDNNDIEFNNNVITGLIKSGLRVKGRPESQIVTLSYVSHNPELAAEVANSVAETFIESGLKNKLDKLHRATSWLGQKIDEIRARVVDSEAELKEFQSKEGLIDSSQQQSLTSGKLETLNRDVIEAQRDISELSRRYGPKHPKMIEVYGKLANARSRLKSASQGVVQVKGKEFSLAKLEREVETNRELYEIYLTRLKETDLSTDVKLSNARIIDQAEVPGAPFSPNRARTIGIWSMIGFILGLLFALLREQTDNTFKTIRSVEEKLKLAVLGVVPLLGEENRTSNKRNRKRSAVIPAGVKKIPERYYIEDSRSSFAEAINHIRTGIVYSNVDNPPKTILVSSSVQSEGKTTLASNLALSFAQLGRTLLIDADLRKPRVGQVTRQNSIGGLVEYVAGDKSLQDCVIQDKDCKSLFILNSGSIPPNPLELLSSRKLKTTIDELGRKFDHIIIDTAPVLPVSDAIVLGHVVDEVVMVIKADKTTVNLAKEAIKKFNASSITPLGVALSQLSKHQSNYYYGDGHHHHYYGDYMREEEKNKNKV